MVSTEMVLLLLIYAMIILRVFFGPSGPIQTFAQSGPSLGARIERNVAIGYRFRVDGSNRLQWQPEGE
ncbi:MAG: hypothetical protein CL675_00790 [Bdellovibrionaceae bacterium]|nr:hypothetical protein [Pseudobdellovibrionaceae bacterium]